MNKARDHSQVQSFEIDQQVLITKLDCYYCGFVGEVREIRNGIYYVEILGMDEPIILEYIQNELR